MPDDARQADDLRKIKDLEGKINDILKAQVDSLWTKVKRQR